MTMRPERRSTSNAHSQVSPSISAQRSFGEVCLRFSDLLMPGARQHERSCARSALPSLPRSSTMGLFQPVCGPAGNSFSKGVPWHWRLRPWARGLQPEVLQNGEISGVSRLSLAAHPISQTARNGESVPDGSWIDPFVSGDSAAFPDSLFCDVCGKRFGQVGKRPASTGRRGRPYRNKPLCGGVFAFDQGTPFVMASGCGLTERRNCIE